MEIIDNKLHVGDQILDLPEISAVSTVSVWRVPADYRENGVFFSVYGSAQAQEVPACSLTHAQHLGDIKCEPSEVSLIKSAKARKMVEFNARCNSEINALTQDYPEYEVASWPQQVKEAEQLVADPSAPTPLLTSIGTARGIDVTELALRVTAKMADYALATGSIIGRRQAAEDRLELAITLEQVEGVEW